MVNTFVGKIPKQLRDNIYSSFHCTKLYWAKNVLIYFFGQWNYNEFNKSWKWCRKGSFHVTGILKAYLGIEGELDINFSQSLSSSKQIVKKTQKPAPIGLGLY